MNLFGKYIAIGDGFNIDFAPLTNLSVDGIVIEHPTDEDYFRAGYKQIVDEQPQLQHDDRYMQNGYTETDRYLIVKYTLKPIINYVREFSKYKIIQLCMKNGIWQNIKDEIEKHGLMDLFNAALVFREDDEFFKQGLQLVKNKYGYDDATLNSMLDQCLSHE